MCWAGGAVAESNRGEDLASQRVAVAAAVSARPGWR